MRRPSEEGQYVSKSGLFLIELLLSIFFFIAASAVVLQLFVRSHLVSERAVCISHAITHTQNIAEVFGAGDGSFSPVKALYEGKQADIPGARMLLMFDKDWNYTPDPGRARYCVFADYRRDTDFAYVTIYVSKFFPSMMENISADPVSDDDYGRIFLPDNVIHRQEIKKYVRKGQVAPYEK